MPLLLVFKTKTRSPEFTRLSEPGGAAITHITRQAKNVSPCLLKKGDNTHTHTHIHKYTHTHMLYVCACVLWVFTRMHACHNVNASV